MSALKGQQEKLQHVCENGEQHVCENGEQHVCKHDGEPVCEPKQEPEEQGFVETAKETIQDIGIGLAHAGEGAKEYLKSKQESVKSAITDFQAKYHSKKSEDEMQHSKEAFAKAATGNEEKEPENQ